MVSRSSDSKMDNHHLTHQRRDEIHDVAVEDIRWHVRILGEGPPVLLLHGFTGSMESWEDIAASLATEYTVVMPDLPGHGASSAPADPKPYTMDRTCFGLSRIAESLGYSKLAVVGYSMGGRIALGLGLLHPDKVLGLCLESASPGLRTQEERMARRQSDDSLAVRIEEGPIHSFVDAWEALPLFATQRQLPTFAFAKQRRIRLANSPTGLANSLRGIGTGVQPCFWERLSSIGAPVCLITGEFDAKFRDIAYKMEPLLQQAVHVEVPGAGHSVHLEKPREYLRIIREFLSTQVFHSRNE